MPCVVVEHALIRLEREVGIGEPRSVGEREQMCHRVGRGELDRE